MAYCDFGFRFMGMNITRENCLNCYFFASMYDIHFLKSEAREKICKNFSSVIRSQDFLGLPIERVTHILSFSDAKLVHIFNLKKCPIQKGNSFKLTGRVIYKLFFVSFGFISECHTCFTVEKVNSKQQG